MAYLIRCRDVEGSGSIRDATIAAHRAYVDERAGLILLSGPLTDDDGDERRGQLFVLDAPDRGAAERFIAEDPFTLAGVFAEIDVDRLEVKFSEGSRTAPARS